MFFLLLLFYTVPWNAPFPIDSNVDPDSKLIDFKSLQYLKAKIIANQDYFNLNKVNCTFINYLVKNKAVLLLLCCLFVKTRLYCYSSCSGGGSGGRDD